jgi:hypothetical protein
MKTPNNKRIALCVRGLKERGCLISSSLEGGKGRIPRSSHPMVSSRREIGDFMIP